MDMHSSSLTSAASAEEIETIQISERRAGRIEKVTAARKMDREAMRAQREGEIKGMESN